MIQSPFRSMKMGLEEQIEESLLWVIYCRKYLILIPGLMISSKESMLLLLPPKNFWTLFKLPPVFPVYNYSAKIVLKIRYASKIKENLNKTTEQLCVTIFIFILFFIYWENSDPIFKLVIAGLCVSAKICYFSQLS